MPNLTAEQYDAIQRAAKPLSRDRQHAFIEQVIATLQREPELGPGVVYRAIARLINWRINLFLAIYSLLSLESFSVIQTIFQYSI